MSKGVFFFSIKILFLLIFLKSCGNKKLKNQHFKNDIRSKKLLKEYVAKFNKYDNGWKGHRGNGNNMG